MITFEDYIKVIDYTKPYVVKQDKLYICLKDGVYKSIRFTTNNSTRLVNLNNNSHFFDDDTLPWVSVKSGVSLKEVSEVSLPDDIIIHISSGKDNVTVFFNNEEYKIEGLVFVKQIPSVKLVTSDDCYNLDYGRDRLTSVPKSDDYIQYIHIDSNAQRNLDKTTVILEHGTEVSLRLAVLNELFKTGKDIMVNNDLDVHRLMDYLCLEAVQEYKDKRLYTYSKQEFISITTNSHVIITGENRLEVTESLNKKQKDDEKYSLRDVTPLNEFINDNRIEV